MRYKGKDTPFLETPYLLWILLALPMLPLIYQYLVSEDSYRKALRPLISPTGQYGAWLIILALSATPLNMLLKGRALSRWLIRNRRYIGVAGFFYAAVHTVFYLGWRGKNALPDALSLSMGSGWILLVVLIPLAVTSTDAMVRRLGPRWKKIQRWSYVAGGLTLAHWVTLHNGRLIPTAVISFTPLALLILYRVSHSRRKQRARESA